MNATQWLWEAESMAIAEEDRVEELEAIFDIVKSTTIRLLGLNINPIEEEDGRLRPPEDTEIIPLSIWSGNEVILKEVLERNKQMVEQDKTEAGIESGSEGSASDMSADELDALMNDFGDIEFDDDRTSFENPQWNSEDARTARKQLIQVLDVPGVNKKSRVTIQEIDDEEDEPPLNKSTNVVVESIEEPE